MNACRVAAPLQDVALQYALRVLRAHPLICDGMPAGRQLAHKECLDVAQALDGAQGRWRPALAAPRA